MAVFNVTMIVVPSTNIAPEDSEDICNFTAPICAVFKTATCFSVSAAIWFAFMALSWGTRKAIICMVVSAPIWSVFNTITSAVVSTPIWTEVKAAI